jgi:biopolymer transport protein ExbD
LIENNPFSATEHTWPMSEINTTPLVDVMLVLLVIFIITAPILTHAVKIDLPQATSLALSVKPGVISLWVNDIGQALWNDILLVDGDLTQKLNQLTNQELQPELQIRADKNTRYQILAKIMADAQNAGVTKLGFVSDPSQEK